MKLLGTAGAWNGAGLVFAGCASQLLLADASSSLRCERKALEWHCLGVGKRLSSSKPRRLSSSILRPVTYEGGSMSRDLTLTLNQLRVDIPTFLIYVLRTRVFISSRTRSSPDKTALSYPLKPVPSHQSPYLLSFSQLIPSSKIGNMCHRTDKLYRCGCIVKVLAPAEYCPKARRQNRRGPVVKQHAEFKPSWIAGEVGLAAVARQTGTITGDAEGIGVIMKCAPGAGLSSSRTNCRELDSCATPDATTRQLNYARGGRLLCG
ncbi:hypothetical protein QBC46DRAFT_430724 [Diplogelasinospora grovesii]|uniref:Uncharacterized protein n=1 Tax=Diplogelasinospora grovesii TaxID=303347 RepID=A0AAN6MXU1_9PEZI|nr:hypothetical protein QBC46DRAFT_430724 [Diplogelasinospora grovesii]